MTQKLITQRLELTLLTKNDAVFIAVLVNTAGWIKFIGDRNVHSLADAEKYIEKIMANPNINYRVIKTKENMEPVGVISFIKRDYLEHWDIGFALLPQACGKGFAYEGTMAVLQHNAACGNHPKFLATVLPDNTVSVGLLHKLGFHFEKNIAADAGTLMLFAADAANFKGYVTGV
jgi:RimJ/RimL family protein N-acetyltransferase